MKQVSIQDLKSSLSAVVAEVESGRTIVITRHNAPVARLSPAGDLHVHRGSHTGTARLKPALKKRATKGRYLGVLLEDRQTR